MSHDNEPEGNHDPDCGARERSVWPGGDGAGRSGVGHGVCTEWAAEGPVTVSCTIARVSVAIVARRDYLQCMAEY